MYAHRFEGHFPREIVLLGSPLDSVPSVVPEQNLWHRLFIGQMHYLSANQTTQGNSKQ